MATIALSGDERAGLAAALALHAALIGVLLLRPGTPPPPMPQRVSVTISDTLAPRAASPAVRAAAPAMAPVRGEPAPQPAPAAAPPAPALAPAGPEVVPVKPAPVQPAPVQPQPVERAPAPSRPARVSAKAPAKVSPTVPAGQPPRVRAAEPDSAPAAAPGMARGRTPAPAGASRIGRDFLSGVPDGDAGSAHTPPAAAIGPATVAAIGSAIARQLKPHWSAPQGIDAEQLVTVVQFRLNRDGSLAGAPRVVRQSGITPGNQAQQQRHAEQAVRAIELSAPFDLPPQYYAAWQTVTSRFDRKLSQ